MRIKAIELEWFRGAAEAIRLDTESKSLVVYGENGAGKSCFVDAVEFILNQGKIGHLAHEYSGKHQEKGIINTHTPKESETALRVEFRDGAVLKTEINRNGTSTSSGTGGAAMDTWDYRRTVLRQDEVAAFIRDTKGGKYSALLPLLGLHPMELAAENLRQLARMVEQQSGLREARLAAAGIASKRSAHFGAATDDQIHEQIQELHAKYCPNSAAARGFLSRCDEIEAGIDARTAAFSSDLTRYRAVKSAAELGIRGLVGAVRSTSLSLASTVEPLIAEKLEVLESSRAFVSKLAAKGEVECPVCGQSVSAENLRQHVAAERERHRAMIDALRARKAAVATLCDELRSLRSGLEKSEVRPWRDELAAKGLAGSLEHLDALDLESLRAACGEKDLEMLEDTLAPLIDAAAASTGKEPPDVVQLSADGRTTQAGRAALEGQVQAASVRRTEALISIINFLEEGVREEIRLRSQRVIEELSSDIQEMWAILHPGEAVEGIHLYLPDDADKAIDIGLKFHGIEQGSPRLTLSEGFRNSLGLCIFLAMAKKEAANDRPLFLDDVVVSLDRNHRGMIVDLLEKEFSARQVIILTHDREWYTELRHRLDSASWSFKVLMPYENPQIGIRWSASVSTFDDARGQLTGRPDSAGNTARKIMDSELAMRAQGVKVRLPYLHRERNDHRTAHDFLSRLIADGEKCFKKKGAGAYEPYSEAIQALREADKLLVSWGNRASHSFDVVKNEAAALIETCERALRFFECPNCKRPVHRLDDQSSGFVQCQCSHLRWHYGKA